MCCNVFKGLAAYTYAEKENRVRELCMNEHEEPFPLQSGTTNAMADWKRNVFDDAREKETES